MQYVVISFKIDVMQALDAHYNGAERDSYTAQCPECDEAVTQLVRMDAREELVDGVPACPYCGTPIIWDGSRLWTRTYGSPAKAMKRLALVEPKTETGQLLMSTAKLRGWANESEQGRWRTATRRLDDDERVGRIINWCVERQRKRNYATTGRALVAFALNSVEKAASDIPVKKRASAQIEKPTGRAVLRRPK